MTLQIRLSGPLQVFLTISEHIVRKVRVGEVTYRSADGSPLPSTAFWKKFSVPSANPYVRLRLASFHFQEFGK
jgi:hypothetical protein